MSRELEKDVRTSEFVTHQPNRTNSSKNRSTKEWNQSQQRQKCSVAPFPCLHPGTQVLLVGGSPVSARGDPSGDQLPWLWWEVRAGQHTGTR